MSRYVDRLLESQHFGERMAIEWLDAARYADSNGFQADSSRKNWPWRDWVIRAFNANMPFDQFTIRQLSGDLLPGASRDDIVATGFNRNHRINGEGGLIAEEWLVETVIDRTETTSQTWLGLTVGCAPLPRPQIRPADTEGILFALRLLQLDRRVGRPAGQPRRRQHRPSAPPSRRDADGGDHQAAKAGR